MLSSKSTNNAKIMMMSNTRNKYLKKNSIKIIFFFLFLLNLQVKSQIAIGTFSPSPSAQLEITSTNKGLLLPRMTEAQRNAISSPAAGLILWCTNCGTLGEMEVFDGLGWKNMLGAAASPGIFISSITCPSELSQDILSVGKAFSKNVNVPFATSNISSYPTGLPIPSKGVKGLTATLQQGNLTNGAGTLVYSITGAAASDGILSFDLGIGDKSCKLIYNVSPPTISSLNCLDASVSPTFASKDVSFNGAISVNYSGGNGAAFPSLSISSTGVSGLTASLSSGILSTGDGILSLSISGTPTSDGIASFAMNFLDKQCVLNIPVRVASISTMSCAQALPEQSVATVGVLTSIVATVSYTGGNEADYPAQTIVSTGVNGLTAKLNKGSLLSGNGNLSYQITGIPESVGTAHFSLNFGGQSCEFSLPVTMPSISLLKCDQVNFSHAASVDVSFVETIQIYYEGGSGGDFASKSILSTGVEGLTAVWNTGTLASGNGSFSLIISGTPASSGVASFALNFLGKECVVNLPVISPIISSLLCNQVGFSETATPNFEYRGIATLKYIGGNGAEYISSAPIASSGVEGLTAELEDDILANGDGSISFTIYGTPSSAGVATFTVEFAGKTCLIELPVNLPSVATLECSQVSFSRQAQLNVKYDGAATVPYTAGNGSQYISGGEIASTGVLGLKAKLTAGTLNNGAGNLTYTISGIPTSAGLATFPINIFGKSCVIELNVTAAQVASLNCSQIKVTGVLPNLGAYYGESVSLPYSGGNGGYYSSDESIVSTGVEGLSLLLISEALAIGDGVLTYSIAGIPKSEGIASFALNFGGQSCVLNVTVNGSPISSLECAQSIILPALVKSGVPYIGTTTVAYSGGNGIPYYSDSDIPSTGVTGLVASLEEGELANGDGSLKYSITGTPVGYGTAIFTINFGGKNCELNLNVVPATVTTLDCNSAIYLPANLKKGVSYSGTLNLHYTGGNGAKYAAQEILSTGVTGLKASLNSNFLSNSDGTIQFAITGTPLSSGTAIFALNFGGQICTINVPVLVPLVTSLNCTDAISPSAVANVGIPFQTIATVQYADGDGSNYNLQEILSTGVLGLKAKLNAGTLVNGSGSLSYSIYGKALSEGTANFEINFGGQTCSFAIEVSPSSITSIDCSNVVSTTTTLKAKVQNYLSINLPYSGGNTIEYATDTIQSTGVTGLIAVLNAGLMANGNGDLSYTIAGKPGSTGTANFSINFGGQNCFFSVQVESLKIGDSWGGGIVGYIDESGEHGIILGPLPLYPPTYGSSTSFVYSDAVAACNNYASADFYEDWTLPTRNEFTLMWPYFKTIDLRYYKNDFWTIDKETYPFAIDRRDGKFYLTQSYTNCSIVPIRKF
jgi:hypothetical protein